MFSQKITDNQTIHQVKGNASNIYILEDNHQKASFLVDCGMPSDAKNLVGILRPLPPLKSIVCTHFHVDHASGWIRLKKIFPDCGIMFHEKAKPFVTGQERIPYPTLTDYFEILRPCMKESRYFPGLGDLFQGGIYGTPLKKGFPLDRVTFFTSDLQVLPGFITIHTPGHRPDSVSFFEPNSGIFITGDFLVVINNKVVVNTFVAGRKDQEDSIETIKNMEGIRFIYAGHGDCVPFEAGLL